MLFANTLCSATQVVTFHCPKEEALRTQERKNMAWRIRSTELSCNTSPLGVGGIRGEISRNSYEGGGRQWHQSITWIILREQNSKIPTICFKAMTELHTSFLLLKSMKYHKILPSHLLRTRYPSSHPAIQYS